MFSYHFKYQLFVAKYFCMLQLHVAAIPKNYMGTGFRVSLTPNRDLQNKNVLFKNNLLC